MSEITDKQLVYISNHDLNEPYRFAKGTDIHISTLAAELLQSRQDIAVLQLWHDALLAGNGGSVEMAFVNFRNWTPEMQHKLGMMLLPDYATLTERLKAAQDDAERIYVMCTGIGLRGGDALSQHEALVAQEA
jgi:hypothetical protein